MSPTTPAQRRARRLWVLPAALALGCGADAQEAPEQPSEIQAEDPTAVAAPGANWGDLYTGGITFEAFLSSADRRVETWNANYSGAAIPSEVLDRARSIPGTWRVLAVAEDWCGDSANTIPYLAKLIDEVEGFEMRVVNSTAGRAVMDAHPTPDGRGATPTVVVLDGEGNDVGCWVERPAALQDWFLAAEGTVEDEQLYERKYAWYDWDVGNSTVSEIVSVIEAAAAGTPRCAS